MGEEQNEGMLFPPTETEDEWVSLQEDDGEFEPPSERKYGKGRFVFLLCFLPLLLLTTVFPVLLAMKRNESGAEASSVPEQSEASSHAIIQSEPSQESSVEESADAASQPEESATYDPYAEEDFHGWIINSMGYTYLYHGLGVEQFNYSAATTERYLSGIRSLAGMVPEGTSVYCMPVPTRIGFLYAEISDTVKREDDFFNSWQQTFLDTVEERLRPEISVINLYEPFAEAYQAGQDLFFRTDKNWTADAAYLAYQRFCSASGNAAVALSAYGERQIEGFLGSFYIATGAEVLRQNADKFRYYQNDRTAACKVTLYSGGSAYKGYSLADNAVADASDAYSVYLGRAGQRFRIESPCTSGKKLLVVGDGSAAAMMPFLIENYSEIQYIDIASYSNLFSELFASDSYHDVLFISYVTNTVKGEYPAHLAAMAGIVQEDEQTNG